MNKKEGDGFCRNNFQFIRIVSKNLSILSWRYFLMVDHRIGRNCGSKDMKLWSKEESFHLLKQSTTSVINMPGLECCVQKCSCPFLNWPKLVLTILSCHFWFPLPLINFVLEFYKLVFNFRKPRDFYIKLILLCIKSVLICNFNTKNFTFLTQFHLLYVVKKAKVTL